MLVCNLFSKFIFTFKRQISAKAQAKLKIFDFIKRNQPIFIKILFSSNLLVGFLVSFKEYLDSYIKYREHLLIASISNLDIKIFNFHCINNI